MWSAYRKLKNISLPQLNILTATPQIKEYEMSDFKYFKLEDFDCQETGENEAGSQLRGRCSMRGSSPRWGVESK